MAGLVFAYGPYRNGASSQVSHFLGKAGLESLDRTVDLSKLNRGINVVIEESRVDLALEELLRRSYSISGYEPFAAYVYLTETRPLATWLSRRAIKQRIILGMKEGTIYNQETKQIFDARTGIEMVFQTYPITLIHPEGRIYLSEHARLLLG